MWDSGGKRLFNCLLVILVVVVLQIVFLKRLIDTELNRPILMKPGGGIVQEVNGTLIWLPSKGHMGMHITPIRDLGKNKSSVLLLIIVSSAPLRWERREAVRKTWWRHCKGEKVACSFFTDVRIPDKEIQQRLLTEKETYRDIKFQPLSGGSEFGLRFLYQAMWASATYDFQYFLRVDDDYFVCLKKLLNELQFRPKQNLCWGHFHCPDNLVTWMDESWMVYSHDIIRSFLAQDARTMLCHPHADQQIAIWLSNNSNRIVFHDSRLNHRRRDSLDVQAGNVCDHYLGVHKAYPSQMLMLGKDSGDGAKDVPPVANFSAYCPVKSFDYKYFNSTTYFFEPKPCIENFEWVVPNHFWYGDEGKL